VGVPFVRSQECALHPFLIIGLAWAAAAMGMKLSHAVALRDVAQFTAAQQTADPSFVPPLDYAYGYGTQNEPSPAAHLRINPVWLKIESGHAVDTPFDLPATSEIVTNVVCFPWNHLTVDGQVLPYTSTIGFQQKVEAFISPPGHHVVGYEFDPDPAWLTLKILSKIALFALLIAIVASFRPTRT